MIIKRRGRISVFVITLGVLLFGHLLSTYAQQNASPWLAIDAPTLKLIGENEAPVARTNYNLPCVYEKGITRKASINPRLIPPQISEQSTEGCATYTAHGKFIGDYLLRPGTELYGRISAALRPIPGSTTTYTTSDSDSLSTNINLVHVFPSIDTRKNDDGSLSHQLGGYSLTKLRDKSNNLIRFAHNSLFFSKNTDWLAGQTYSGGARINLRTGESFLFSEPLVYGKGLTPISQGAISNDGRYAVFAVYDSLAFRDLRIYDLQNCLPVQSQASGRMNCDSRDLLPSIREQLGDIIEIKEVRFSSDYYINFYATYRKNSKIQTSQYSLTAAGQALPAMDYLALGDSYASGEGNFGYHKETDTSNNTCHQSPASYPYLLGEFLNFYTYDSVACSGGKIKDINMRLDDYPDDPQSKGKNPRSFDGQILSGFLPGYRPQVFFLEKHKPKVITLSMGGNDIGFGDMVASCAWTGRCFDTYEKRLEKVQEVNRQFDVWVKMYNDLREDDPSRRVYVLGYPQIAKNNGDCAVNVRLNEEEVKFSNLMIDYLNSVIERAARKAGVRFVDVSEAFYGHRLCETESNNIAVHGLTAGKDRPEWLGGPLGAESYHPTTLGHQLFMEAIIRETDRLTQSMPEPDRTVTIPALDDLQILNAPKTEERVRQTYFRDDVASDLLIRNSNFDLRVEGKSQSLKENATYEVWLHSNPLKLGEIQASSKGDLTATVNIPKSVVPGVHTLHVVGQNAAGELIDIYKAVYVADSETDVDGDGLSNKHDNCPILKDSTEDIDQDGIDDACDGIISTPSPSQEETKPLENNPETAAGNEPEPPLLEEPSRAHAPSNTSPNPPKTTNLPSAATSDSVLATTTTSNDYFNPGKQNVPVDNAPEILEDHPSSVVIILALSFSMLLTLILFRHFSHPKGF